MDGLFELTVAEIDMFRLKLLARASSEKWIGKQLESTILAANHLRKVSEIICPEDSNNLTTAFLVADMLHEKLVNKHLNVKPS